MELLFKNEFCLISWLATEKLGVLVWLPTSADMAAEDFKNCLLTSQILFLDREIQFIISDNLHMGFPVTPDLQAWAKENITSVLLRAGHYKKHAFIMPVEFIANLAIEQFVEENQKIIQTQYFSDMTSARKWILEK